MEAREGIPQRYLTVDELKAYLKVSPRTIYRLVDARAIPFMHVGPTDTLRFDIKAIDKWMEKQTIPPVLRAV